MLSTPQEIIKQFILETYPSVNIDYETNIFSYGYISSLFAMRLVAFIEKEFEIKFSNKELKFENFKTINNMCAVLNSLTTKQH